MQRERRYEVNGKRIRGLKARVGYGCCISRREATWARLSSGGIPAEEIRRGSHSAGKCKISKKAETQQGGQLQE